MEVSPDVVELQLSKITRSRLVMRLPRNFLMVLTVLGGGAVFAQSSQIPQDLLDLDYQRCVSDCVPGFGEATCKPLCECTVGEFKKQLDFDAYLELSVQLSRGEISLKSRVLLDSIAKLCTAEIEKDGIQVGEPAKTPAPADTPQPEGKPG
jgi:hypothetical protein